MDKFIFTSIYFYKHNSILKYLHTPNSIKPALIIIIITHYKVQFGIITT